MFSPTIRADAAERTHRALSIRACFLRPRRTCVVACSRLFPGPGPDNWGPFTRRSAGTIDFTGESTRDPLLLQQGASKARCGRWSLRCGRHARRAAVLDASSVAQAIDAAHKADCDGDPRHGVKDAAAPRTTVNV